MFVLLSIGADKYDQVIQIGMRHFTVKRVQRGVDFLLFKTTVDHTGASYTDPV